MLDKAGICLTDLDFFGKFYYFTFNKSTRFTSSCGGILSLGVLIGFIVSVYFLGKDIIYKRNPVVVFNYDLDYERYNRNLNVPTAFLIENINGVVLDGYEKYFTFSALYINFSKADITKDYSILRHNIPMRKCSPNDFSKDLIIQKSYKDNNLQYAYCMNLTQQVVGGSSGQMWNFYVNVTLEPCANTSGSNITCKSDEEIKNFIMSREIQVSMYYEDMILTSTNNSNPLTKYLKNDHQRIQLNTAKTNEYFLQDVVVETDNGWIVPSKSNHSTQILTTRFFDFYNNNLLSSSNKTICAVSFNIFASVNKYEILRTYIKLQDVLAQLGGISKVVFMFIEGFLYLIYSHKHEELLIKNMYPIKSQIKKRSKDFKAVYGIKVKKDSPGIKSNPPEKKDDNSQIQEKKNDYNILNTSNQLFINSNNVQITKQNNDEIHLIKNDLNHDNEVNPEYIDKICNGISVKKTKNSEREEGQFNFSYAEVFVIVFCLCFANDKLKKKEKMFRILVEHTKKYSDGMNVIKSVNEIEKIKNVIFDEKQIALFNLLCEPRNPLSMMDGEIKLNTSGKEKTINFEVAKSYLTEIKLKRRVSVMDKRLIELYQK
jgi:hypothetical protein